MYFNAKSQRIHPVYVRNRGMTYLELYWFGVGFLQELRQVDGQESRDMSAIEQADVPEVDGFLKQHRRRDHLTRDEIPRSPHVVPLLQRREREGRTCDCRGIQ